MHSVISFHPQTDTTVVKTNCAGTCNILYVVSHGQKGINDAIILFYILALRIKIIERGHKEVELSAWRLHMATFIFSRGLVLYVWVDIITLSHL